MRDVGVTVFYPFVNLTLIGVIYKFWLKGVGHFKVGFIGQAHWEWRKYFDWFWHDTIMRRYFLMVPFGSCNKMQ